ncbi:MAG: hypothetical protein LKI94_09705, partial [Sporolactobacillus sp.]|nr:hypothetical protein [Sporolactobacillus sp.]
MKKSLKKSLKWGIPLAVITFVLAAIFSIISTAILGSADIVSGIAVVLVIILFALFFDIIGVAATASNESPFHAMASKKMRGARYSLWLTKNADRVNTFCTDVIGDISAIISGTAASVVVGAVLVRLAEKNSGVLEYALTVLVTAFVAAITVFVKSLGKTFAIDNCTAIIYRVGYVLYFLEHHLHLPILDLAEKKHRKMMLKKRKK